MRRLGMLVLAVAFATGCSAVITDPNAGSIDDIVVGADTNGVPVVEYPAGLEYNRVETRILWEGEGERLAPDDRILLDMYAISLDTGAVLTDTFTGLPNAYYLARELVGDELYEVLVQVRVGARILHISPPVPGYQGQGAIAIVVDVLPAVATGEFLERREDLPIINIADDGEPTIILPEGMEPPTELIAVTLIQGPGEQVHDGSLIKVNYLGISLETGEVFESSWDDGEGPMSAQIGVGEVPAGWDQGLLDRTEGSQVLLIIPPELAYGDDTLIFVIDILAVWNSR